MNLYVQNLNFEGKVLYERQLKEHKEQLLSTNLVDSVLTAEPSGTNAPDGTDANTMNTPSSQNILSPDSQNISDPQFPEHSTPPISEPPPQISPALPSSSSSSLPPTAPRTDQEQGEQRTGVDPNTARLTMEQAWELFALVQARKAAEVERPSTIEAHHVEVAPPRAEPLSFLTMETVEGIVGSTDFCTTQGQTSWESKMEKFVNLGHACKQIIV
jgi:hypothetical protein